MLHLMADVNLPYIMYRPLFCDLLWKSEVKHSVLSVRRLGPGADPGFVVRGGAGGGGGVGCNLPRKFDKRKKRKKKGGSCTQSFHSKYM